MCNIVANTEIVCERLRFVYKFMAESHEIGKLAEKYAANFLQENGYTIVRTNYRFKSKELDIIAENKEFVVFVEVKLRGGFIHQNPEEAVMWKKQKYMVEAANYYLQSHPTDKEARFDIIAIEAKKDKWDLKHLVDAFQPRLQ